MSAATPDRPSSRDPRTRWLALALVAVTVLAFARALGGTFLWDDDLHVSANPVIIGPLGLKEIWTTGAANYFPLVLTNFWVQHALWGLHPLGYHIVTLGCHVMAALLLWRVLTELRVPGAWLGAALWAVHPVQVESVAWICELKNTQSAVFFLLSVWAWIRWLRGSDADGAVRGAYALALTCALAALLSKPSTVMLPVVLVLVFWWERRRFPSAREAVALAPFFALSAVMSGWTIWEQKYHSGAIGEDWNQSAAERVVLAGRVVWFYLGKLVAPANLSFIYPRWRLEAGNPLAYLPTLLAAVGLGWLFLRRARMPGLFVAGAFFAALLFPVLGFFDVYFFRYAYVGDHFQYLASMAPLALFAAGVALLLPRTLPAVGGAIVGALVLLSAYQAADYRSPEALWTATVARNPNSPMAWTQLGSVLGDAGRHAQAIACYQRTLRLNPRHPEALNHLGIEHLLAGRLEDATRSFEAALAARDFPEGHLNLGVALQRSGRVEDARRQFEVAAQGRPTAFEPHLYLGIGLAATGRFTEALTEYETALRLAGGADAPELHHQYANALCQVGRVGEALPHYEASLHARPDHAATLDDCGLALAAAGRADEAFRYHQRALAADPNLAPAHNNLGVLLAKRSQLAEALAEFEAAARLDPRYLDAQMNRGMALVGLDRVPEAATAFARAVELQPSSAKAHAFYAQVLHALGREAEAQAQLALASRLENGNGVLR